MTKFEKRQHPSVFISAGRKAFLIATDPVNNPYSDEPARRLWNKGFFDEGMRKDFIRPAHGAAPVHRQRYPAHLRQPFGTPIPEKPFKRFVRHYAEASVSERQERQERTRGRD